MKSRPRGQLATTYGTPFRAGNEPRGYRRCLLRHIDGNEDFALAAYNAARRGQRRPLDRHGARARPRADDHRDPPRRDPRQVARPQAAERYHRRT
jgi:hypothetical protein